MPIEDLMIHPIFINHHVDSGQTDEHGNAKFVNAGLSQAFGYFEYDKGTSENTTDRDTADTFLTVYLAGGVEVAKTDTLTIDGVPWQVEGDPSFVRDARTDVVHHIELRAHRIA